MLLAILPATAGLAEPWNGLVFDGHNDLPLKLYLRGDSDLSRTDLSTQRSRLSTDIPRLRQGRVGAQFWSANIPDFVPGLRLEPFQKTLQLIATVHRMVELYPDDLALALTAGDVVRVQGEGKIASLIGVEGGHTLEGSLANLETFYERGVRYLGLAHFRNNPLTDSATDDPVHGGLSALGRAAVRRMNDLGMIVDVAHASEPAAEQAMALSRAPVIFSHAGLRAVVDTPRNVSDRLLDKLKDNGGVIGVIFCSRWINEDRRAASLADVADEVDHVVARIGIDHVGIGSDFDGDTRYPSDLDDVSKFPNLVRELERRGYAADDLAKIFGGNFMRVLRVVEERRNTRGR